MEGVTLKGDPVGLAGGWTRHEGGRAKDDGWVWGSSNPTNSGATS